MSSDSSARRAPPVASASSPLPALTMKARLSLSLSRSARGSALPCSAVLCSALLCWGALGACGDTSTAPVDGAHGDTGSADVAADTAADASGPAPRCATPTPWEPGGALFADRTQEWGLDGVQGARVSAEDLDGDGWVDLVVRRGGVRWDTYEVEEAVRHQWVLRNEGGRFSDITQDSGLWSPRGGGDLNEGRPGEVVAFGDVDNDGDLDAYVGLATADVTATRGQTSELMRNAGGGVFSFAGGADALRRLGEVDAPAGAAFVDVDRDGSLDLWVGQHNAESNGDTIFQHDRLFLGDTEGGFTHASAELGLVSAPWDDVARINAGEAHTRAWSAAACDLNGDGRPELLASSYGRSPNHLWQQREDGTFTNRSVASGYAYDEDQTWTDNQFAACFCQSSPDAEGCEDAVQPSIACTTPNWRHSTDREPFRLGGNSGATVCADLDNDGQLDLFTTEIRHWWAGAGSDASSVLRNTGASDVAFERLAREDIGLEVPHVTGLSWDEGHISAAVLDVDNDGWKDIFIGASEYAGNRGLLYLQRAPMRFKLVSTADAFEHNRAQGVAAADVDNDGDLDLIVGHSRSRCDAAAPNNCYETAQVRAFENLWGQGANWIQLDLEGAARPGEVGGANRDAVGARVTVEADGVTQTFEVAGGFGHYGAQNPRRVHVGLGAACEARVSVRWPDADASEESFDVVAGYRYDIGQGEGIRGWSAP